MFNGCFSLMIPVFSHPYLQISSSSGTMCFVRTLPKDHLVTNIVGATTSHPPFQVMSCLRKAGKYPKKTLVQYGHTARFSGSGACQSAWRFDVWITGNTLRKIYKQKWNWPTKPGVDPVNLNSLYIDYRCSVKPFVNFSLGTILELKSSALPALERRQSEASNHRCWARRCAWQLPSGGPRKKIKKILSKRKVRKKFGRPPQSIPSLQSTPPTRAWSSTASWVFASGNAHDQTARQHCVHCLTNIHIYVAEQCVWPMIKSALNFSSKLEK